MCVLYFVVFCCVFVLLLLRFVVLYGVLLCYVAVFFVLWCVYGDYVAFYCVLLRVVSYGVFQCFEAFRRVVYFVMSLRRAAIVFILSPQGP